MGTHINPHRIWVPHISLLRCDISRKPGGKLTRQAIPTRPCFEGPTTQEYLWHKHQEPTPSSTPLKAKSPSASLSPTRPLPSRTSSNSPKAKRNGHTPPPTPNPATSSSTAPSSIA